MNRSAIMRASAVISFLFGIPLLIAPNVLTEIYRSTEALTLPGTYNSMLLGAGLIAFGVINWIAAKSSYAEARVVIIGSLVFDVLGFVVTLTRQLMGVAPTAAWVNVAIFLVLAVLYMSILRAERAPGGSRVTPT
jgi:hypothetical protein